MPIECKRLPTPSGADRDEREYVVSKFSSTGGIERFKAGKHGAAHRLAAMIGYVQDETRPHWAGEVTKWIQQLITAGTAGWSTADLPQVLEHDNGQGLSKLLSSHARDGLQSIELRHLWISMN